jgi:hypothetical protein
MIQKEIIPETLAKTIGLLLKKNSSGLCSAPARIRDKYVLKEFILPIDTDDKIAPNYIAGNICI